MIVAHLSERLAGTGWNLERVLPRDGTRASLHLHDAAGRTIAAQWFADVGRADRVEKQTAAATGARLVGRPLPDVVTQRDGADRRLRDVARLCAEPGARLRAHRPERRAVVEIDDGGVHRFVKAVRPEKLTANLVRAIRARFPGVPTPAVVGLDEAAGTVTTAALQGTTLHEAITTGDPALHEHLAEVGRLLARLHTAEVPEGTPRHGAEAEIAVVDRWLGLAGRFAGGALPWPAVRAARARLPELLHGSAPHVLLHRDLHDKQLVLGPDGPGLLDLDLLAVGDPALDLANLVVHLELRARQGLLPIERAAEAIEAVVAGYRPDARTRAGVPGYLLATRLRLVAVYAFRLDSTAAARLLLTDPLASLG